MLLNRSSGLTTSWPDTDNRIYGDLVRDGLMEQTTINAVNIMRITARGIALVEEILALPMPKTPEPPRPPTPAEADDIYWRKLESTGMAYELQVENIVKTCRRHMREEISPLVHTLCRPDRVPGIFAIRTDIEPMKNLRRAVGLDA